jgi:hypothetical protein
MPFSFRSSGVTYVGVFTFQITYIVHVVTLSLTVACYLCSSPSSVGICKAKVMRDDQTCRMYGSKAVPWLRRLVGGLSPWRPGFTPGSIHVGFVVDKVALAQVFLRVLRFFPCQYHSTVTLQFMSSGG